MKNRGEQAEIESLINEYTMYKSLSEAPLRNSPYHAYYDDLIKTIKMCDEKLTCLYTELKKIKEED